MQAPTRSAPRLWVAYGFAPVVGTGTAIAIVALTVANRPGSTLALPVAALVGISFAAERMAPYEPTWNHQRNDARRDLAHVLVNECTLIASLVLLTKVGLTDRAPWPDQLPIVVQIAFSVLVLDVGISLAHFASHRSATLWRFHAVHHSVPRFYNLNGLMKHPLHQMIEATAGMLPLLALGIPSSIATASTALVAAQLLLQHSNVDMRLGRVGDWLALAPGHRQHHLADAERGDVNFGLFLLVWDRLLGTYSPPGAADVRDGDLGVAGRPDYPVRYLAQLAEPFR